MRRLRDKHNTPNKGVFEALLSAEDAVISDELNHASIIDGIRLCKAKRFRYKHLDCDSLREQLILADKEVRSVIIIIIFFIFIVIIIKIIYFFFFFNQSINQPTHSLIFSTKGSRYKLIATDGAFSMDGDVAPLDKIVKLAEEFKALIFVDECHATGLFGPTGRGTPEYFGVEDKIDIINSTLGKAMGGATGGYTVASKAIVDLLRQKWVFGFVCLMW